ncbi:hypothetical protein CCMA1212_003216 [Trichoderma ghanense]|uniref:Uncharacterized protein n=1 Tax=Trichoderma ghanense TaxID=65468 RepID=A0ABY2HAN5_9HYPO
MARGGALFNTSIDHLESRVSLSRRPGVGSPRSLALSTTQKKTASRATGGSPSPASASSRRCWAPRTRRTTTGTGTRQA